MIARRLLWLAIAAAVAMVAAGSALSSSNGSPAAEAAAARKAVAPYLKPPVKITVRVPLPKAPPKGIKVGWLVGNFAAAQTLTAGMVAATKALGWQLVQFTYDPSNPQTINSAMQNAVDRHMNYIAITGVTSETFASALASAKKAKIPVVELDDKTEPNEHAKGILACIACNGMLDAWAWRLGEWVIADSGAKANMVYFTIPTFPSLIREGQTLKKTIARECSQCTFDEHDEAYTDLTGGNIGRDVAAYLQTHPNINYIYFAFGQMESGVRATLDAAGIGQNVKFVTADPGLEQIQEVISGKMSAAVVLPNYEHVWVAADAMARNSLGKSAAVSENSPMVMQIWTKANVPQPAHLFLGAKNYEFQYKNLWHVR